MILTLIIFLTICGCDEIADKRYGIKIINNSNVEIMVTAGCSKFGMYSYPDTILPVSRPSLISVGTSNYNYLDHSFSWEEVIEELPSDTLSIYVFEKKEVSELGWKQIRTDYKVLIRKEYSSEDLTNMNYTITYP